MNRLRWLAALAALLVLAGAGARAAQTEYLMDMTSEEVAQLEEQLSGLGYLAGAADAVYDADTRLAIESFQQANGLEVSGEPNAETLALLESGEAVSRQDYLRRFASAYAQMTPLKQGSVNNQVLVMQRKLKEYGYFTGQCDGVYGDATQLAVESFQMANGLTATGVADGATLMRLMAENPETWPGFLTEMSCMPGDTGLNVYVLQKKLWKMGYFEGDCTGSYGDLTQKAVMELQAENGLEQTGAANAETWALIYSGSAVSPRREDVMQIGDFGEDVQNVQQRLSDLGYFDREITGEFDATMETAVRLFQMAVGLASTGEVDAETLERLTREDAPTLQDEGVQAAFQDMLEALDADTQGAVAEIASQLLGTAFQGMDDDLYPGFRFVQYVCVAAGLPVTQPETLIRLTDQLVGSVEEVDAGNVVAFQNASGDSVTIMLTIGAGDGRIIYATAEGGWVVMTFMDQMEGANIYRWGVRAE